MYVQPTMSRNIMTYMHLNTLTAPGGVTNIMVSPNSAGTEANITWVAPDVGVDVVYSVVITNANNDVVWSGSGINTTNIMATGLGEDLKSNCVHVYLPYTYICLPNTTEPFILYTVTITPSTTGGSGPPMSTMFYTREEGMSAHTRCTLGISRF